VEESTTDLKRTNQDDNMSSDLDVLFNAYHCCNVSKSSVLSVILSSNETLLSMPCIVAFDEGEGAYKVKRSFHLLLESSILCSIYCPSGYMSKTKIE